LQGIQKALAQLTQLTQTNQIKNIAIFPPLFFNCKKKQKGSSFKKAVAVGYKRQSDIHPA